MLIIPANVEIEISSSRELYTTHGRCIFCSLMDENLSYETTVFDLVRGKSGAVLRPASILSTRMQPVSQ